MPVRFWSPAPFKYYGDFMNKDKVYWYNFVTDVCNNTLSHNPLQQYPWYEVVLRERVPEDILAEVLDEFVIEAIWYGCCFLKHDTQCSIDGCTYIAFFPDIRVYSLFLRQHESYLNNFMFCLHPYALTGGARVVS